MQASTPVHVSGRSRLLTGAAGGSVLVQMTGCAPADLRGSLESRMLV